MKCLSIGYLIAIVIVLNIVSGMQSSKTLQSVFSLMITGATLYYLAGFFVQCDHAEYA